MTLKINSSVKLKKIFFPFIIAALSWLYPIVFLYTQNIKETDFKETLYPSGIMIICTFSFYAFGLILFRGCNIASIYSVINAVVLGNLHYLVDFLQNIFPSLRYWHILGVVSFAIIIACAGINKTKETDRIVLIAGIVFGILVAFNFVGAIPTGLEKIRVSFSETSINNLPSNMNNKKSNIYFLLCDEYASFAQLEQDFGYSNEALRSNLDDLGFYISETSQNDAIATAVVVANIMSLEYIADENTTSVEIDNLTKTGKLHSLLNELGYSSQGIGKTDWLGIEGTINSEEGSGNAEGENFTEIAMGKSFLYPFFIHNYLQAVQDIVNTFKDLKNMDITPNEGKFLFFYVACPHHPYYFLSDGSMNNVKYFTNYDGSNPDAYIGQVEYTNNNIIPAIKRIIEYDPDSIIVLCSDHGNRFGNVSEGMSQRILNAVYYKGEVIEEFEGMSSVNTLIYILNHENELKMEYVSLPK